MKLVASSLLCACLSIVGLAETASARPFDPFARGAVAPSERRVEVEWAGSWYPSTILAASRGQYLIHYEGWSSSFDEWVPEARLRFADGVTDCAGEPTAVQIAWGGQWYPGRLMKTDGGRYLVHYDGWSSGFDEWVGADRLAFVDGRGGRFDRGDVGPGGGRHGDRGRSSRGWGGSGGGRGGWGGR